MTEFILLFAFFYIVHYFTVIKPIRDRADKLIKERESK